MRATCCVLRYFIICAIERGERNVSLLNLIVLAHACGAGLGVLLEGVDENAR